MVLSLSDILAEKEPAENIDGLMQRVQSASESIEGVRDAEEEVSSSTYANQVEAVRTCRGRPLFYPYISSGLGRGPYVQLLDGSVKMDLINGMGVHLFGHSHPKLLRASLEASLQDVVHQGHLQSNALYITLSKKLQELAFKAQSRLKHVWLSTCGTMANENALKVARQKHSGANKIIALEGAFAGRSTIMAEVTDNPAYREGQPSYNEVLRLPFGEGARKQEKALALFKKYLDEYKSQIATFVFEPVLGEGGYYTAPKTYFLPLLELCREHQIAVWVDEIQTFGRSGFLFAFEALDIAPYIDICTIAKSLQVAATLWTSEYNPKPGLIGGTFAGTSSSLACALETLHLLTEGNFLGHKGRLLEIRQKFVEKLLHLSKNSCRGLLQEDVGGIGLMVGVTPFDGSKEKTMALLRQLFDNHLMAFSCGHDPYRLRFLLPAVLQDEDIDQAIKILEKSLLQVA